MAPSKRGRKTAASTSRGQAIPRIQEYPEVVFASQAQRDAFETVMKKEFRATMWLCVESMKKLGLDDGLNDLFEETGTSAFYGMHELSYKSLTYEFLSSFFYDEASKMISFRMLSQDYTMSISDLGDHFDMVFDEHSLTKVPDHFQPHMLWKCITGSTSFNSSRLHIREVSHPVLRFWLRTMNETLFGRNEPGNTNCLDLAVLGSHLNVERKERFSLHLGHFLAKHFYSVTHNKHKKMINIGGVITYLAKKVIGEFDESALNPVEENIRWMDLEYFHTYIRVEIRRGRWYFWRHSGGDIPFPMNDLPSLDSLEEAGEGEHHELPSYTIGNAPPPPPQANAPSPPHASPHRSPHVYMQEDPHVSQFHVSPAQASYDGFPPLPSEREQYLERSLTQYGLHHSLVMQGHIARAGPHPGFYTDPNAPFGGYPGTLFARTGIDQEEWYSRFGQHWRDMPGSSGHGHVGGSRGDDDMDDDGNE